MLKLTLKKQGFSLIVYHLFKINQPQSEDKVEGGLLLNVVVGQSPAILQLLAGEDQPLLVWGNSLLVLKKFIL